MCFLRRCEGMSSGDYKGFKKNNHVQSKSEIWDGGTLLVSSGICKVWKSFFCTRFHAALENIKHSPVRTDFLRYINLVQLALNGTMEWKFNVNLSVNRLSTLFFKGNMCAGIKGKEGDKCFAVKAKQIK